MKPTTLDSVYQLLKPIIFGLDLDAETMHEKSIEQIRKIEDYEPHEFDSLSTDFFSHHFTSPLILAAGFDKNGLIIEPLPLLGFACEVVGSITAKGSKGNKRPRLWRLPKEKGILNRMGLNGNPADVVGEVLEGKDNYIVSITKTHDPKIMGDEAIDDFVTSYRLLKDLGIYTEINISCPNTVEGKTFENPDDLESLLKTLIAEGKGKPLLIKISPNLDYEILQGLVEVSEDKVDGYVATNTLPYIHPKFGKGGLSGLPLQSYSLRSIATLRSLTNKPIVGVGGLFTGQDAFNALSAGADLLQAYTGFIYRGPLFASKLASELDKELKARGMNHISEIKKCY